MFDFESFYNLKSVDLKKDISLLLNSSIDFISIDKQISYKYHLLHSKHSLVRDFFIACEKLYLSYQYYFDNFPYEMKLARKYNNNFYRRTIRLKKRISFMLDNFDCLFLTITFNETCLNNTSLKTRRKYVTNFLSFLNCFSVANIDYGNGNEYIDVNGVERVGTFREHYHAIVTLDFLDNSNSRLWSYGGVNIERIITTDNNTSKRTSKYLAKLTSHAVKSSTDSFNNSIIYIKPKKIKKLL